MNADFHFSEVKTSTAVYAIVHDNSQLFFRIERSVQLCMKLRAPKKLKPTMSRVYPERKWIKERRHHREKRNINRLKQISILVRSLTKRKPDIRESGEKEKAPQRQIHKTD
jgi:hypothetical protein